MVDVSSIREHMTVIGSDGAHVGTVDAVEGDRIKLTRTDSRDGTHHYVPVTQVARVDEHVHLSVPAISAVPGGAGAAAGAAAAGAGVGAIPDLLPETKNRAVEGATPRRNFYLPWIVGLVGLLLLFLLFKSCVSDREREAVTPVAETATTTTAAMTNETVVAETPTAPQADALAVSGLGGYLGGAAPTPATFTFEKLNFDTGKSEIRATDRDEVNQVAAVLKQYANARIRIAGYADARGDEPANAQLGQARADAVKQALVGQGIAADRVETTSGGESDPVDTNATAGGRFENRRTELVVLAR